MLPKWQSSRSLSRLCVSSCPWSMISELLMSTSRNEDDFSFNSILHLCYPGSMWSSVLDKSLLQLLIKWPKRAERLTNPAIPPLLMWVNCHFFFRWYYAADQFRRSSTFCLFISRLRPQNSSTKSSHPLKRSGPLSMGYLHGRFDDSDDA